MQSGHDTTVLSGEEESEEGGDSKNDEYKSEEKCKPIGSMHWFVEDEQLLLRNRTMHHFSVCCAKLCFCDKKIDFLDIMV